MNSKWQYAIGIGSFLFCVLAVGELSASAQTFTTISNMTTTRTEHEATLLYPGQVLITGGIGGNCCAPGNPVYGELFEPKDGTFTFVANETAPATIGRIERTATRLNDGRILIAGGVGLAPNGGFSANAEVFDPKSQSFVPVGSMMTARHLHAATRLHDGRVLITGGAGPGGAAFASAELFDPDTGTFSFTGSMATARYSHQATLLYDGRVLVTGGYLTSSAEIYDPRTGAFVSASNMNIARESHTATLLHDGRVLIAGGDQLQCGGPCVAGLTTAELFDPRTEQFVLTGSMTDGRSQHTATLLHDGTVLVAGGFELNNNNCPTNALASAELFDPGTETFTVVGAMTVTRLSHRAELLHDGTVLITGGQRGLCGNVFSSAEIFSPR
jgi:hypothetical protein